MPASTSVTFSDCRNRDMATTTKLAWRLANLFIPFRVRVLFILINDHNCLFSAGVETVTLSKCHSITILSCTQECQNTLPTTTNITNSTNTTNRLES